jgi:putative FmdB family regulatory protein
MITEARVPTYQYACTACGHQLEAVQSFSDAALSECPVCDGRLRKLFSAVGIVFKGSGFYRTDSRSGSSSNGSNGSNGSTESTTTTTTETKSESKSESTGTTTTKTEPRTSSTTSASSSSGSSSS